MPSIRHALDDAAGPSRADGGLSRGEGCTGPALSGARRRVRTMGRVAVLLGLAGLLTACRTVVNLDAVRDAQTAAQVKSALVNDPDVGATTIEVSVVSGTVRLSGAVRTQADADKVAALARGVSGVRGVQLNLRVGDQGTPGAEAPRGPSQIRGEPSEPRGDPRLLALGVAVGWSGPQAPALGAQLQVGPLIRIGSGRGLGPAVAFNWFQAESEAPGDLGPRSRIHVRPVMAGVGYTLVRNRLAVSPSLVGGVAFNSLTAPSAGAVDGLAVEVANSLIWRPGVSVWFDVNRRAAVNVSAGYLVTQLRLTYFEGGQLVRRDLRGDTTIIRAGVAYKIF